MILKNKTKNNEPLLIHILDSDIPELFKGKLSKGIEILIDLVGVYKANRNLWEFKLKEYDDPRYHDFYAVIARLAMYDMIIADLENLKEVLIEI